MLCSRVSCSLRSLHTSSSYTRCSRPIILSRCTPTSTTVTIETQVINNIEEDYNPLVDSGSGNNGPPNNDDHRDWNGDGKNEPSNSIFNPFSLIVLGIQGRIQADPFFLHKLFIECALDALIIISVNMGVRGERFIAESEFTLCQLAISLFSDFALVYLLAPSSFRYAAKSDSIRAKLEALPAHIFQRTPLGAAAPFTPTARLGTFFLKAVQYGSVGLVTGGLGAYTVKTLVTLREQFDPDFQPPKTVQSIKGTGLAWSGFMATSSNIRYNLVNFCEDALYTRSARAGKLGSVILRLMNNYAGAAQWVALTNRLNLNIPWEMKGEKGAIVL